MFTIETTDDIKVLKELTSLSTDPRIQKLEREVADLTEMNQQLLDTTQKQNKLIKDITESLVTADKCRDIVFDLIQNRSKKENLSKTGRVNIVKNDTDEVRLTKGMQLKYSEIVVKGNCLINHTHRNQEYLLPITTLELLSLIEIYQYRQRKLLNKDSNNICKLFGISKVQFGKLYYNIKEGIFFPALNNIDKQIRQANFKVVDNKIFIIDGGRKIDTKIDIKKFNYLVNIYINSNQPYATIYKLSKEEKDIDPIDLLMVLRRHKTISKII